MNVDLRRKEYLLAFGKGPLFLFMGVHYYPRSLECFAVQVISRGEGGGEVGVKFLLLCLGIFLRWVGYDCREFILRSTFGE